ncbi:MAG TPA: acetylxylan esterase, partial [Phycisphaerae bacterium]|nr:acetylxylan esterase [Phycisphaerae bacterium]
MNTRTNRIAAVVVCLGVLLLWTGAGRGEDSLRPLKDAVAPRTLDELWRGYDPRAEPLETTVVREWKQEDVTCRYVVFTIGTFKGKRSRLAGFYAFGSAARGKLPGLLHLHGGGQRANLTEVIFMARNGYAALSINWGAREMEGQKPGEPNTDWGRLDATQTGHNTHYRSMQPDDKTLDAVESPRNNNWFLLVLAARRALTFLERQEQVDGGRLGVCGHSMGGKLTTDLSGIDERVCVAVPSCGGSGSATSELAGVSGSGLREAPSAWDAATIDDRAYLGRIRCPILYLSPTNDFHAALDNMAANWRAVPSREVRYAVSP